ncbi:MAG: NIPSNAP family protein [Candidatus Thorarchaeota archaeon]
MTIYLQETLNLTPATPETLDNFVELSQKLLIPACEHLGARMVVAWFSNYEWYSQVTHVFEFDNLDALKEFRINTSQDKEWGEYTSELDFFAPERRSRLLEPIGAIPPDILHKAIDESQETPQKVYSFATLDVTPNKMIEFVDFVNELSKNAPIIASWRPIAGKPNEVNDLWKGSLIPQGYQPAVEGLKPWFKRLRELAPKERLILIFPLPYSQLQ